jgi:hypothetical protein
MPTLIAEKLYRLVDGVASSLLADPYALHNITTKHAQTIHLLTTSITRIKNGCTLSETMEQQNHFLEGLPRRNPTLAEQIVPYLDEYNSCQASFSNVSYPTSQYAPDGSIPFPVEQITENALDRQDHTQLQSEIEEFLITKQANEKTTLSTPTPHKTTHQPPKPTTKPTRPRLQRGCQGGAFATPKTHKYYYLVFRMFRRASGTKNLKQFPCSA